MLLEVKVQEVCGLLHFEIFFDCLPIDTLFTAIESLSKDDGDGKEKGSKAVGLYQQQTTLHVHHAFLYIF